MRSQQIQVDQYFQVASDAKDTLAQWWLLLHLGSISYRCLLWSFRLCERCWGAARSLLMIEGLDTGICQFSALQKERQQACMHQSTNQQEHCWKPTIIQKQECIWKCLITESFALDKNPEALISVVALAPYRFLVNARPCVCLYLAQAFAQRWEGSRVEKFYIVQEAVWLQMRSRICKKFKTWCY